MFIHRLAVLMLVSSVSLLMLACGSKSTGELSREQAIDIAAHHLIGKSFDVTPPATVVLADGKYTVSFRRPAPDGAPGETYTSKVVFDAKTREALEIEIRENTPVAAAPASVPAPAPAAPAYRLTPLQGEVDHVEVIRKQFENR